MTMLNQLLKVKGHDYFSVGPERNRICGHRENGEKNVGSVLVMDGATLVGIFTERDYARNVVLKGGALRRPSSGTSCQSGRVRRT